MDKSLIYLLMGLGGLLMSMIPFGVFMGLATQFGINNPNSPYLLTMLFVLTICIGYLSSLGAFAAIQAQSCGKVKNMKQIAGNAGLSTTIIMISLLLAVFIPGLKYIVTKLFHPVIEANVAEAMGYAYYIFWGTLYGFAAGGFMAANCGAPN